MLSGTGKTNTLATLLCVLLAHDLNVHATAPTNAAILELFKRCSTYPHIPRDLLLVGNLERLKIDPDRDPVANYHLGTRAELIEFHMMALASSCNALITVLRQRDEYKRDAVFIDAVKSEAAKLLMHVEQLRSDAPEELIESLQSASVNKFESSLLAVTSTEPIVITDWLQRHDELESTKTFVDCVRALTNDTSRLRVPFIPKAKDIKKAVFQAAKLVFSTVNSGGKKLFDERHFDVVLIDEATQLVHAETAIVLKESVQCLVLAGDEKQLPSTVISQACAQLGYGDSLFGRLITAGYPYKLLNIQYRMHPDISRWSNMQFYDGQLVNGPNVVSEGYIKPWHAQFPTLAVFDVSISGESTSDTMSMYNIGEVMVVKQLLRLIRRTIKEPLIVGILSPYAEQISLLSTLACVDPFGVSIRTSTIDGYQGQESDIIIFTTVRSNSSRFIGHVADPRRLNVAITRARYSVLVIGDVQTITSDGLWRGFIEHARTFGTCFHSSDSEVIQSAEKKLSVEANTLLNVANPDSAVLSNAAWGLSLSHDCKVSIPRVPKSARSAVISKIVALAQGQHPKLLRKEFAINPLYSDLLFAYKLGNPPAYYVVLWSVSLQKDGFSYKQCIILWDVLLVSDQKAIKRTLSRIESTLSTYSSECIQWCEEVRKNGKIRIPITRMDSADTFKMFKAVDTKSNRVMLEDSQVENASALMKFYPVDDCALKLLLEGKKNIDLPFVMSEEERSIVDHPSSMFIIGRSGTGTLYLLLLIVRLND